MSSSPTTLVELFLHRAIAGGDQTAIHVPRGGVYSTYTWNELARDVRQLATALASAGVQPGDRVVQVSENRYEWIVTDLAVHLARGVHVAVHPVLSGPQIAWQIADSEPRVVIVSTTDQAGKLATASGQLPPNLRFFSHDACDATIAGQSVRPLSELVVAIGDSHAATLDAAALETRPDDLATILYSSGTTGEPKGVMLTHGNLTSNAVAAHAAFDTRHDDMRLCFLPLSHIFARTCDLYTWLAGTSQLALAENRETIIANCGVIRPTVLNGVPYFYERVMRALASAGPDAATRLAPLLGGRVRCCCSGGAALPNYVAEFFAAGGVLLVQGYGLTESSPVITMSTPRDHRLGTVGRKLDDVELRIADDGEILTRGPHVMRGYWRRPQATAEVLREGWLHTGDLGSLDADGYLTITGRKKELIVTAGGKNIAPVALEAALTQDPLIVQAVVIGDGRNYLTALIVPNLDLLREELAKHGGVPEGAWLAGSLACDIVRRRIDQRLAEVSRHEQVRKFTLLDRPFTLEAGEMTPTLKLRRPAILAKFAPQIEAMYRE